MFVQIRCMMTDDSHITLPLVFSHTPIKMKYNLNLIQTTTENRNYETIIIEYFNVDLHLLGHYIFVGLISVVLIIPACNSNILLTHLRDLLMFRPGPSGAGSNTSHQEVRQVGNKSQNKNFWCGFWWCFYFSRLKTREIGLAPCRNHIWIEKPILIQF